MFSTLALVLFAGCATSIPEQLEAASITPENVEDAWSAIEADGTVAVKGEGQDWTLGVGGAVVRIHSPGHSDLSALNGRDVTVEVSESGLHGEHSMLISDAEGPAYFLNDGAWSYEADALFGAGFATWGDTVATDRDDQYNWSYTEAVFQSDAGPVYALPGEVTSLRVGGETWRVVVIAAYQVDAHPWAALPCGGISDLLSYEMVRVETEPEPVFLSRPAGMNLAFMGCL